MPLIDVKNAFIASLEESVALYRHCLSPIAIHSDYGVEAAFLQMYNSWEIFLEETLVSLLAGDSVITGSVITPKFTLPDRTLIREVLYQEKSFLEWTRDDLVRNRFDRHLQTPNRITKTINTIAVDFKEMIKVRNYIAHSSASAKEKFEQMYQKKVGGNPNTTRASFYLKEVDRENRPHTLFDRYARTLNASISEMIG